jgi:hypothetical protein
MADMADGAYGVAMRSHAVTLRTSPGWLDGLWVVFVGLLGWAAGGSGTGLLAAVGTAAAVGVWRAVRFLGVLVEHAQAAYADDEEPVT